MNVLPRIGVGRGAQPPVVGDPSRRRFLSLSLSASVLGGLALAGCSSSAGSTASAGNAGETTADPTQLSLVGYSVAKAVYDVVQPAFAKTAAGNGVTWQSSYGASGDQSRQVVSGLAADFVAFSLAPDVTRLVDAGLVAKDWDTGPTKGMVSNSVVAFVVRKGNPNHITGWDDLVGSGVKIVTPNPGSSGAARWNILGAYSHGLRTSKAAGQAFLTKFYDNVVSLPASGREATSTFTGGTGDVLISYENEAILARQSGADLDYVVPTDSFLIQNPVAVTTSAPPAATAFLHFALSRAGQGLFVAKGFRPVVPGVPTTAVQGANDPDHPFPKLAHLTTIDDLGGWSAVDQEFFADDGLVSQIQKAKGLG